jgi:Sec-independent protein secretion pathway component TatC
MNTPLIYQAVLFGVALVLIGLILSSILGFLKPELPKECEIWDKYYVMEVTFFFTGIIIRYLLVNPNIRAYVANF